MDRSKRKDIAFVLVLKQDKAGSNNRPDYCF